MKIPDFSSLTKIFKKTKPQYEPNIKDFIFASVGGEEIQMPFLEAKNVPASFQMSDEDFYVENWRQPYYQSTKRSAYDRMRKSYWTTACIEKYRSALALVRPICQKWDQKSENFVRVPNHPIEQLIDSPNEYQTTAEFFAVIIENLWLTGNALISIKDTRSSGTIALEALNTDLVKLELGTKNGQLVEGYEVYKKNWGLTSGSGRSKFVNRKDMIHIRLTNSERLDWGISPLESVKDVQETEADAVAYNRSLMSNSGRPSFVLCCDDPLNKLQRRMLQQAILEDVGRDRSGLPLVLTHGVKPVSVAKSPVELDYIKADRLNGERIASIFQIPSPLININENATLANVKEFVKLFWSEGVMPKLYLIFQAISKYWVTPRWGSEYRVWFDTSAIPELMEHTLKKAEIMKAYIDMGWTANELNVFLELGLPYNPAGDIRMWDGQVVDWGSITPPSMQPYNQIQQINEPRVPNGANSPIGQRPGNEGTIGKKMEDIQAVWSSVEFSRNVLADLFRNKVLDIIHKQLDVMTNLPVEAIQPGDMKHLSKEFVSYWQPTLEKVWFDCANYFVDSFSDRYKKEIVNKKIPKNYVAELNKAAAEKSAQAAEHIAEVFAEFISTSMEAGFSYEEAIDNFKNKSVSVAHDLTQLMLEKSVVPASNLGNQIAAKLAGCTKKTWHCRRDAKTHEKYDTIDGETRLLNEKYSDKTLYPGDPDGAPKQFKNYRCFETYE